MTLRENIAGETIAEVLDQMKDGEPRFVECTEGYCYVIDGVVDLLKIADAILAIPEIAEALAFKRRSERPNDPNSVHGVDHWSGH